MGAVHVPSLEMDVRLGTYRAGGNLTDFYPAIHTLPSGISGGHSLEVVGMPCFLLGMGTTARASVLPSKGFFGPDPRRQQPRHGGEKPFEAQSVVSRSPTCQRSPGVARSVCGTSLHTSWALIRAGRVASHHASDRGQVDVGRYLCR